MSTDDYRRALEAAAKEYEALGAERQRIDKRLGELAQTISTLSRLCGIVPTVPWGLTDACRMVVRNAGVPMTPAEVRDRLQGVGVDLSTYANALAAIHTTLKRLNDTGELRSISAHGLARGSVASPKVAYVWNRPPKAATLGPDVAEVMRQVEQQSPGRKRGRS
jgi:hypothetical protein